MLNHDLAIGVLITVALLAIGHWFPWLQRLTRLWAYAYGVGAIWIGFIYWQLMAGDWQAVLGLTIIITVGGLTVVLCYQIDHWVKLMRKGQKAEAIDESLRKS
jgi:hypothetical protein